MPVRSEYFRILQLARSYTCVNVSLSRGIHFLPPLFKVYCLIRRCGREPSCVTDRNNVEKLVYSERVRRILNK